MAGELRTTAEERAAVRGAVGAWQHDPSPYAGPGDLVTAEDVAEWLRERAERALLGNCHPPTHVLHYALVDLRARLDRERRQGRRRAMQYKVVGPGLRAAEAALVRIRDDYDCDGVGAGGLECRCCIARAALGEP